MLDRLNQVDQLHNRALARAADGLEAVLTHARVGEDRDARPSRTTSAWSKGADVNHPRAFLAEVVEQHNARKKQGVVSADGAFIQPLGVCGVASRHI